jgi:hypothetical protein
MSSHEIQDPSLKGVSFVISSQVRPVFIIDIAHDGKLKITSMQYSYSNCIFLIPRFMKIGHVGNVIKLGAGERGFWGES